LASWVPRNGSSGKEDSLPRGKGSDLEQITEQMHAVWLAKKVIERVCSGEVARAAHDCTRELNYGSKELAVGGGSGGLSGRERELRAPFLEAARRELGFAGDPLQRRAYADRLQHDAGMPSVQ